MRRTACNFLYSALLVLILSAVNQAQTTQPVKRTVRTHAEFLKLAQEYPLAPRFLLSSDGKPLTEEQNQNLAKADQLLNKAETLRQRGEFSSARDVAEEAMQICRSILGPAQYLSISATGARRFYGACADLPPDRQLMIKASDKIAALCMEAYAEGNYAEAEKAAKSAIERRERVFGTQFNELVDSDMMSMLGLIQTQCKKYKDAEETLDRVIKVIERSYGKNHPKMAVALARQGWLLLSKGQPDKALEILRQAASIMNNTAGENLEQARILDYLGTACALNGDNEGAVYRMVRSLVIREKLAGPDSAETGEALSNLAWLYSFINLQNECEPLRRRAMAIFKEKLVPEHPYVLIELANVAQIASAKGEYDEAIKIFEKYVGKRREIPTLNELKWPANLGVVYLQAGRYDDARRTFKLILDDARDARSSAERDAARQNVTAAINGLLIFRLFDDAEAYLSETKKLTPDINMLIQPNALIVLDAAIGKNNDVVEVADAELQRLNARSDVSWREKTAMLSARAKAFLELGKLDQAEQDAQTMAQLVEAAEPPDHLAQAACFNMLGRVHLKQNKIQDATFDFQESLRILDELHDTKSPIFFDLLLARSELQIQQKQYDAAKESLDKSLEMADKVVSTSAIPLNKTFLLEVLKQYHDLLKVHPSSNSAEIESKLKSVYSELKNQKQLDAKSKTWAAELGA